MSKLKIAAVVVSGVSLVFFAWVLSAALASLDRRPLHASLAAVESASAHIESVLATSDRGLADPAKSLARRKELAPTLRQYAAAINAVRPGQTPLPPQQTRIDKVTQKLDELRAAVHEEHQALGPFGLAVVNEVGLVVSSDSHLFKTMQTVELPPSRAARGGAQGGEHGEGEGEAPTTFIEEILTGVVGRVVTVHDKKVYFVAAAPIPHPTAKKKWVGAVLVDRELRGLAATPGAEATLIVDGTPTLGALPQGVDDPDLSAPNTTKGAAASAFLLQETDPRGRVLGTELPTLAFLPQPSGQSGLWAKRFVVPGTSRAWGYVYQDVSGVYADIRGLQSLAFFGALVLWLIISALVLFDGREVRKGLDSMSDFLSGVLHGTTQERAIAEGTLPVSLRRLGKLVNQTLEHYVGGEKVTPLAKAPSVEQVLREARQAEEVVATSSEPPDFSNLQFEGIHNAGTLEPSPATETRDGFDDTFAEAGRDLSTDDTSGNPAVLPTDAAMAAVDTLGGEGAYFAGDAGDDGAGDEELGGPLPSALSSPQSSELSPPSGMFDLASPPERPLDDDDESEPEELEFMGAPASVAGATSPADSSIDEGIMELDDADAVEELSEADAFEELTPTPAPSAMPSVAKGPPAPMPLSVLDAPGDSTAVMQVSADLLEQLRAQAHADRAADAAEAAAAAKQRPSEKPLAPPAPAPLGMAPQEMSGDSTAVMKVTPELLAQMKATAVAQEAERNAASSKATSAPIPQAMDDLAGGSTAVMKVNPALLAHLKEQAQADRASDEGDARQRHFREVFEAFVQTRKECGEAGELNFDKFAQRLEQSRAAVMAKHHCSDVRFAVYKKDGKAALKATPAK